MYGKSQTTTEALISRAGRASRRTQDGRAGVHENKHDGEGRGGREGQGTRLIDPRGRPRARPHDANLAPNGWSGPSHRRSRRFLLFPRCPQERKRNAIVLLLRYLRDNGYVDSAEVLQKESSLAPGSVDAADNISLERIFRELEEHHIQRFGQPPKLFRRAGETLDVETGTAGLGAGRPGQRGVPLGRDASNAKNVDDKANGARGRGVVAPSQTSTSGRASMKTPATTRGGGGAPDLSVSGNGGGRHGDGGDGAGAKNTHPQSTLDLGAGDLNDLAEVIRRDIHWGNPNVPWESVAGLDDAKRLLKEAVVMPVRYPDLFRGLLSPWRGVLLYGPPGTGKTMLAKAVATECDTTFFNVSSSTVVSKWRGDSEKLVRVLFELANFHAPSTVFIDEIDALMSARGGGGGGGGEHEASRRMKTELLIQMDGLASPDTANGVFVLCATNLPWELDLAMLRRLEKRVLVGLPNEDARAAMTTNLLGPHKRDAAVSLGWVAKETEGYSGSDVATLCKEMAMRPLRRLMERLEGEGRLAPRAAPPSVGSITEEDARAAIDVTKPSAVLHLSRYEDWCAQFGDHRH